MARPFLPLALLVATFVIAAPGRVTADSLQQPLRQAELLALVAGNALPENLVRDIGIDGLAFHPDDGYRSLLKDAGADPTVLKAVNAAKVIVADGREDRADQKLLEHISAAGKLISQKQYEAAADELTAAVTDSFKSPECGFVMGELLRWQEDWDRAATIYQEVLRQDPSFPETHTKLSYVLYRGGDDEAALREARTALEQTPDNAEAHKNAGLALEDGRKFDAAGAEYQAALRLKSDYEAVRYDLGNMFRDNGELDSAVVQYQKALELDPNDSSAHNNLGLALQSKDDLGGAIREFREAKRLAPNDFDPRQNLASALMKNNMYAQAVVEFRETESLFPDSPLCHECLGLALFNTWDFAGAEKEYRKALELDPTEGFPHEGLANIRKEQKKYDEAIQEYLTAERLDPTTVNAYYNVADIRMKKGDLTGAIEQLEIGENVAPSSPLIHDLYGRALQAEERIDAAIAEFQESIALDPKQIQVMIELAGALEKKGDWVASIGEYRKASLADGSIDLRGKIIRSDEKDPQKEYEAAQERLKEHLAALKASGKSQDAAKIEAGIQAAQAGASLSEQLDAAMRAGASADKARHFDEAIRDYQQAVDLASKIQPRDVRLVTALDDLGMNYIGQNPTAAQAAFERELKVAQELFGPENFNLTGPLQSLAGLAVMQHDYATAEKFFFRAVDVNEKAFGESSDRVADALVRAAGVYFVQQDYAKAEPYLLRALHIDEALYPKDSLGLQIPLGALCGLYYRWNKPDKLDLCDRQLVDVIQKEYGANSPVLVPLLIRDAKALRSLGKENEAAQIDSRVASIRAATMKTN